MTWWVLILLAWQTVSPEAAEQIKTGLAAKREGRWDEAIAAFRKVLELEPGLWAAHSSLGEIYYRKKEYATAVPILRRSLQLNNEQPVVFGMLGVSLLAQGDAKGALPFLERGQVWDALGVALMDLGRAGEAAPPLEQARRQNPKDPEILFHLAQVYGRLSKEAFDRVVAEHPESLRAHQIRAESMAAAGRADVAEQEYLAMLKLRPDLTGIHLALGDLHLSQGSMEKAGAEFRAESALSPASATAALRLGSTLMKLGRGEEALRELSRADQLRPDDAETLYELGKARDLARDLSGAEKAWLQVTEIGPPGELAVQAHYQLSQLYRRMSRAADAEKHREAFERLRKSRGAGK
jgi:predicted Zn-dependent protease